MTQTVPMFDPFTGQPLQPLFDPYTGQPLAGVSTVQAEDAVTVHPTANGGLHDGSTGTILERLTSVEDRLTELEANSYNDVPPTPGPDVKPDQVIHAPSGTADTSSIRATGGVNGGEPAEQTLLESATVPTNDPSSPELPIPAGRPSFTDERDAKPVAPIGDPFTPADEAAQ